jgi:hypothetical protein
LDPHFLNFDIVNAGRNVGFAEFSNPDKFLTIFKVLLILLFWASPFDSDFRRQEQSTFSHHGYILVGNTSEKKIN